MIIGAVLSIVSCANYSIKAVASFKEKALNEQRNDEIKNAE